MEAEVIVHSDFSASDRGYDSPLPTLDAEGTLSEDCDTGMLPTESPISKAFQVLKDKSEAEDPSALRRTEGQTHKTATTFLGIAAGLPRPGESLDLVGSGDSDSRQGGKENTQPCEAFPASLCIGLSSIINAPSVFENVACVHHL